jgi:hypothetical protein
MGYNLSFEDSVNSTAQMFEGINTSMNGIPIIFSLILIWLFVFFLARTRGADSVDSFLLTNFTVSILSGLFMFLGFIGWEVALIPFILLILAIVIRGYN